MDLQTLLQEQRAILQEKMKDVQSLKEQEEIFCEKIKLNNSISLDTYMFNEYTNVRVVRSVNTKKSYNVIFKYPDKTVYFWNDCDEQYIQPITEQGIDTIIANLEDHFENAYFYKIIDDKESLHCGPRKYNHPIDSEVIKQESIEIKKYHREPFNYLEVFNFIGSKRYTVKFDGDNVIVEQQL